MKNRDMFAEHALGLIPKILTLQDRNRLSPTYGCFDRNFWHYKIIDFPSGMAQEFVWPLALAYSLDLPENPYRNKEAIREWVRAGILYAAKSAHADGSCDDYFPFEKAGGAAAFSLLACAESYKLLGLQEPEALEFFARRADWLAHHNESGQLTNHQALIVLCLDCVGELAGSDRWKEARNRRLERVMEWQNPEGWFQEYEGCDPGYHSLTISLLARIYENTPSEKLHVSLVRAIRLAASFVHPDGSYGGEYASRNTYNFFSHGFEVFGRHFPEALRINDQILTGLKNGLGACHADDHILGHHAWNYLLAWKDFVMERPEPTPPSQGKTVYPNAGLMVERRGDATLFIAQNKGGVFRFFRGNQCLVSDTGPSFRMTDGRIAVTHLISNEPAQQPDADTLRISGSMGWAKQKSMTPFRLIVLRLIMLCGGRLFPDLVRKLLQKALITGKSAAPFRFSREFQWRDGRLLVKDRVETEDWSGVEAAAIGCDQTSIYVVMSRTFQAAQMQPWTDLTPIVRKLRTGEALEIERSF